MIKKQKQKKNPDGTVIDLSDYYLNDASKSSNDIHQVLHHLVETIELLTDNSCSMDNSSHFDASWLQQESFTFDKMTDILNSIYESLPKSLSSNQC